MKLACKTAFSSMASHWAGLDVMSWPEGTPRHMPRASSSAKTLGGRNGSAGFCPDRFSGKASLTWASSSRMRIPPVVVALAGSPLLEVSVAACSGSGAFELRSSAISGGTVELSRSRNRSHRRHWSSWSSWNGWNGWNSRSGCYGPNSRSWWSRSRSGDGSCSSRSGLFGRVGPELDISVRRHHH